MNVGAIRGGLPYIPITSPETCRLYLDVRITPSQRPMDVLREVRALFREWELPARVDCVLYRRGYEAPEADLKPYLRSLREAHTGEFGSELGLARREQSSAWRDTNPFNEAGDSGPHLRALGGVGERPRSRPCRSWPALLASTRAWPSG